MITSTGQQALADQHRSAAGRRLVWHGMFLFLLGLVTGTQERRFKNMRMALSAHLEGVMNGTFLMALGAGWRNVELPPAVDRAARWTALYGTYGNWLFTTLGAVLGTAAANPTLSQGHHGKPWQERIVLLGFRSMRYAFLASVVLVLWGLARQKPPQDAPDAPLTSSASTNANGDNGVALAGTGRSGTPRQSH
jgi:(hydroxyamino)benzene mutase